MLFYGKECDITKLQKTNSMCAITKKVIDDFNTLSEQAFLNRYCCRKRVYFMRVIKYGDPYMNAPLAKLGRFLNKIIASK